MGGYVPKFYREFTTDRYVFRVSYVLMDDAHSISNVISMRAEPSSFVVIIPDEDGGRTFTLTRDTYRLEVVDTSKNTRVIYDFSERWWLDIRRGFEITVPHRDVIRNSEEMGLSIESTLSILVERAIRQFRLELENLTDDMNRILMNNCDITKEEGIQCL